MSGVGLWRVSSDDESYYPREVDDIDEESLKSYRTEFELKNPDHVWNSIDNLAWEISSNVFRINFTSSIQIFINSESIECSRILANMIC